MTDNNYDPTARIVPWANPITPPEPHDSRRIDLVSTPVLWVVMAITDDEYPIGVHLERKSAEKQAKLIREVMQPNEYEVRVYAPIPF